MVVKFSRDSWKNAHAHASRGMGTSLLVTLEHNISQCLDIYSTSGRGAACKVSGLIEFMREQVYRYCIQGSVCFFLFWILFNKGETI